MRIFVYKTLVDYYIKHPESKTALEEWFCKTEKSEWNNFAEMKKTFNSVDTHTEYSQIKDCSTI